MCSDSLFAAGFSTFWHAELEAQKKRIAETPENGDNDEDAVLALPSEQVDENHVAAQQSGASEAQDSRVVAEQAQTSEQVDESNLEVRQSGASENNDVLHVVAERTQTSEQVDENNVAVQQSEVLGERDVLHDTIVHNLDSMMSENLSSVVNCSREELQEYTPNGWSFHEHNGRIHIKDNNMVIRIRIDPPDRVTTYTHIHLYNQNGEPLDINGSVVGHREPSGHIPYNY